MIDSVCTFVVCMAAWGDWCYLVPIGGSGEFENIYTTEFDFEERGLGF